MQEIFFNKVKLNDPFWSPRLELNSAVALFHQWQELEKSGCIQNFRLVAEPQVNGFRKGWFFADSDAYKWLEAAISGYAQHPDHDLLVLINDFIALIDAAQEPDGYLYTYNQLIFPGSRWQNLQIEHELYCHGHLIEAAVTHFLVTGDDPLLQIGTKAADLLVNTFSGKGPLFTPGHEEIEIALLRLFDVTDNQNYYDLATHFLKQRGKHFPGSFALHMLAENNRVNQRTKTYQQEQQKFTQAHPELQELTQVPPLNEIPELPSAQLRFSLSALNGKYFQQHRPISRQTTPVGHAVRFAYLQTATAHALLHHWDPKTNQVLEKSWDHMVTRRMAVTGGIGSLPYSEGFGRDYELDPKIMYAETCAALGSMFWNWEMTLLTQDARYADLFEWQLYNASLVGMGQDGNCYLYNNPLQSDHGLQRKPWFEIPCCPSNISRTWAKLGGYLVSHQPSEVWIHQMIGASQTIPWDSPVTIQSQSELPWQGKYQISISLDRPKKFALHLRIPSWSGNVNVYLNNEPIQANLHRINLKEKTAQGYDPRLAQYITIDRIWQSGYQISLDLEMPIRIHPVHPKVKSCSGKAALSRGPIVFCLEEIDNPGIDFDSVTPDLDSLKASFDSDLLGGVMTILGKTTDGKNLKFIPYAWWANRDPCPMTVFFNLLGFLSS